MAGDPQETLAVELQRLRRSFGSPSTRTIAKATGYSHTMIAQALNGKRCPKWPAIEEMVDARRQKQAVLPVQPRLICRVPPRFTVTGYQVHGIFNARNAAPRLYLAYPLLEKSLPIPGTNNCHPFSFPDGGIVGQLLLQLAFPKVEIIC